MKIKLDYLKYSFQNLIHRKMRSWLTIISILIGIMAIYSLVSFGQGLKTYVDSFSEELGTDKLIIQTKGIGAPGTDENFILSKDDLNFVKKVKGVEEATAMYFKGVEIESKEQKRYAYLIGQSVDTKEAKLVKEFFTVEVEK
ncbi:ABC transporter permease, partial [Nanoarchaeota archaeon]